MTTTVTEIISSREGTDATETRRVRRFAVEGANIAGALASVEVPQYGETFPDDPLLLVDDRNVVYRGPQHTLVEVFYSRVSWEGDNIYLPRAGSANPYFQLSSRSADVWVTIERVQKRNPGGSPETGVEFLRFGWPVLRPSSLWTAKLHTDVFTATLDAAIAGELGKIHEEVSSGDYLALFESYDVRQIGAAMWEIAYNWRRMGELDPQAGIGFPGDAGTLFEVTNTDNPGPGSFPAHTLPKLIQFSAFAGGVPPDPFYVQDRDTPSMGEITNLVGLENL